MEQKKNKERFLSDWTRLHPTTSATNKYTNCKLHFFPPQVQQDTKDIKFCPSTLMIYNGQFATRFTTWPGVFTQ